MNKYFDVRTWHLWHNPCWLLLRGEQWDVSDYQSWSQNNLVKKLKGDIALIYQKRSSNFSTWSVPQCTDSIAGGHFRKTVFFNSNPQTKIQALDCLVGTISYIFKDYYFVPSNTCNTVHLECNLMCVVAL